MDPNQRFSIMSFPQFFDGTVLRLNIVLLPRNQNPLRSAIEGEALLAGAAAFADAAPSFVARIVSGLSGLPGAGAPLAPIALPITRPANVRPLFEALAHQFAITNLDAPNTHLNLTADSPAAPRTLDQSVKKYLPHSYRRAFNFVAPRTRNAKTDDAYQCAVRNAVPNPAFVASKNTVNWGQVFATALRQPQLASALGMVYETRLDIDASHFAQGGWLFVDLDAGSDYRAQMDVDASFVRRYAARIPVLEIGTPRSVFGAIQFPVLPVAPPGNYDELFIEAADYDDGFAKIVHAAQPVSNSLLLEESDGFHPTRDVGIRLGWDDEQILVWYIRQLAEDTSVGAGKRIDAPLGAFGYKVDVREAGPAPGAWQPLNQIRSRAPLSVADPATNQSISLGAFTDKELVHPVYPSQLDGDAGKTYWLPMYFAAWAGGSMVLPDDTAASLYQHEDAKARAGINVTGSPASQLNQVYEATGLSTVLRYGTEYQFRVRLGDLSGGGPTLDRTPEGPLPSQTALCRFKRYVAPDTVRIDGLPANTDEILFADAQLTMKRPLLGYPAVVFTDRYADPITLLRAASLAMAGQAAFGIADPDVESVEITVEVQTLKMDNLSSVSGQESYIAYYTTRRLFPKASAVFDDTLVVPLDYRDCKVLRFGDPGDLGDLGVNQAQLDGMAELVLPRARTIRLTIRGVCEDKPDYYGLEKPEPAFNTRHGRTTQFQLRADALNDETGLLGAGRQVRGIFLQPDAPALFDGNLASLLLGREVEKQPDMVQRLAQQLGVENRGLSLVGKRGQRVQFGCSHRIRHTLSPDNSTITFASKGDLAQHWLCCLMLDLERDWTWDGLQDRSLVIERRKRFREDDAATETETLEVGDIEIKRTAPFTALFDPDRSHTALIFIDAVEPRNDRPQPAPHAGETRFPDLIEVDYAIRPAYRNPGAASTDGDYALSLALPITSPPAQIPRLVSAGLALSPYVTRDNYAETDPRRRFLWLEFAEPVRDPKDTYFARVLSNAPDQLISDNRPELLATPDEAALPIDAESIRVVTSLQSNDDAGLDAMQPMEMSNGANEDAKRFYLLPLPSGLHPESPEMFGFFTCEIRIGHHRYTDTSPQHATGDAVWTTAQGRYGRSLRVPGIQHPAPTLTCIVNRDEEKLYVTAPYATAVHNGKNVSADPPRTELWALLYAQVKQADNLAFRNILLDDRVLDSRVQVEHDKTAEWRRKYSADERVVLKQALLRNARDDIAATGVRNFYKLADALTSTSAAGSTSSASSASSVNRDATRCGTTIWSNDEVTQLLAQYGLPPESPMSVLCVETMPHITNIGEHVSALHKPGVRAGVRSMVGGAAVAADAATNAATDAATDAALDQALASRAAASRSVNLVESRPLNAQLGHYRILRTSPLTKVPYVC